MKFIAVWYENDTPTTMYVEADDLKDALIYIFEKKILGEDGLYNSIEELALEVDEVSPNVVNDVDFFKGYFDSLDYESEGFLGTVLDAETGQIVYDYFEE